jgi:hypothetical protein
MRVTFHSCDHEMISPLGTRIANEMFGDRHLPSNDTDVTQPASHSRDFIRNRLGARGNVRDKTLAQHRNPYKHRSTNLCAAHHSEPIRSE